MTGLLRRRLRALHADDSGTALILALLVVLVVGALLAAVLDYVRAGYEIAPPIKEDRNESAYAQGAVEGAINQIRGSSLSGRGGVDCPPFSPPAAAEPGVAGRTFLVTCEGQTVASTSPDGMAQPDFAIQTLGGPSAGIQKDGNEVLTVDGGVYSAGNLTIGGGSASGLFTYGSLLVRGTCSAPGGRTIFTTDSAPACPFTGPATIGAAPPWPTAIGTQSALVNHIAATDADPVPTCSGNSTIVFGPGYYGEAPDALVDRYAPSCTGSVMHFTPGFYYFDYAGGWDLTSPRHAPGIVKVVGGTPAAGLTGRPMGVACDPTQPGVQFVFGGQSTVNVAGNSSNTPQGLELCGPTAAQNDTFSTAFRQRIALVGNTAGQAALIADAGTLTGDSQAPLTDTVTPKTSVSLPAEGRAIGGGRALLASRDAGLVTYSVGDFDALDTVPEGARIQRIRVRVSQQAAGVADLATITTVGTSRVSLTAASASYPASPLTVSTSCPVTSPWCELTAVPSAAAAPFWRDLATLGVQYEFQAPNGASRVAGVLLDGFEVVVDWTAPTLRPHACAPPGCSLLSSGNNPRIYLHGTMHAPTAKTDLRVHNSGDTVFARGIVVRDLVVDVNASSKQDDAPFQLPDATGGGRLVQFKAYVDGDLKVRACVRYEDKAPIGVNRFAAFPGYALSVTKWVALRTPADANSCA